jgi:choline kinase
MKALIIAAGRGERLRPFTDKEPKSLIPLLGLRLIERVILSAKEAMISEFVVVIGYLGKKLKKFLGDGTRYGVQISYVENSRWEYGNGVSVYEARELLKDRFILLMSDHIFNPRILSSLKGCKIGADECMLCVDVRMKYILDINDATKVRVADGWIVEIGKSLEEYNGIDMGIFLCSPIIFTILERNITKGRYSLTESIRELALKGKMRAYCIDDDENYWIDIDTPKNMRFTEKFLSMHNREMNCLNPEKTKLSYGFPDLSKWRKVHPLCRWR